jgi:two-component system, LytTR family, sensor histidine kinase AgrC
MHMFFLAVVILSQILINFFLIASLVAFNDHIEIYGIPIHLILLFLLNIGSLILLAKIYKKEEVRVIRKTESTHEDQYRKLVTSVRSDRHDLNNHLTVVAGLIKIDNFTGAANYINEIIGEVKVTNQALTIRNAVLASILFSKMELYQKQKVPFVTKIISEDITKKISSTDLIRLISNLLDNAYEATVELPKDTQKVVFEMSEDNLYYTIIVKNTSTLEQLDYQLFEHGYTTKSSEAIERGFGLAIIQEVTQKYKGTMSIKKEDSLMVFHLSFPKDKSK